MSPFSTRQTLLTGSWWARPLPTIRVPNGCRKAVSGHPTFSALAVNYAKSVWGGEWNAGIGIAVSNNPAGPFVDRGCTFTSKQIGIQNCIDPFYIEDGGKKYLFFGSFHGIYGVELTADGLHVKQGAKPREVAGTFMEATYIRRRGGVLLPLYVVKQKCTTANVVIYSDISLFYYQKFFC